MNKRQNPFPAFQQQQQQQAPQQPHPYPPLPAGPPPHPAAVNQEWAAYWAAQQAYQQPPQPGWPQQQPQQPQAPPQAPAYDPALYRNYGYGGGQHQTPQWQQQQQQQAAAAAAAARPPPPPPQYAHPQPYPQAYAYGHPYPQQQPPAMPTVAAPPQPMPYGPQYPYPAPPQMPLHPQHQARPPPQPPIGPAHQPHSHQPPAKRPRFDSNTHPPGNSTIPPRPPQQQPPPLHFKPGGGMVPAAQLNNINTNNNNNKFQLPTGPASAGGGGNGPRGGGVALGLPGRGGNQMGGMAGRGRGGGAGAGNGRSGRGMMHGHSGPMGGGMGRGGAMIGGRGGFHGANRSAPRGPASFRQNQSANRFPIGSQPSKMHNTPTGPSSSRQDRARQSTATSETSSTRGSSSGLPTSSSFNFTPSSTFRGVSPFSGSGKRTLTDFRIVGFGIQSVVEAKVEGQDTSVELDWAWGIVPTRKGAGQEVATSSGPSVENTPTEKDFAPISSMEKLRVSTASAEPIEGDKAKPASSAQVDGETVEIKTEVDAGDGHSVREPTPARSAIALSPLLSPSRPTNFKLSSTNSIPVLPRSSRRPADILSSARSETSRIRIYFQCPAELEDKDVPANLSQTTTPIKGKTWTVPPPPTPGMGIVGGKRKKEADDDDDSDEDQKQRDGGKRKREDTSTMNSPVKDKPDADALNSAATISAVKSPKSEVEVEAEMHLEEPDVDSPAVVGESSERRARSADPVLLLEGVDTADESSSYPPDMSMSTGHLPDTHNSEGGEVYDMYNEFDVDAEGEDAGEEDGGGGDWHDQMNWAGDGQESADGLVPFPSETGSQVGQDNNEDVPTGDSSQVGEVSVVDDTIAQSLKETDSLAASPTVIDNVPQGPAAGSEPLKEELPAAANGPPVSLPSPNRLSISYAGSARRLVIDADVIESVRIHRDEGRIDVVLLLSPDWVDHAGGRKAGLVAIKEEFEGDDAPAPAENGVAENTTSSSATVSDGTDADVVDDAAKKADAVADATGKDSRGILIDALEESTQTYRSVPHSTSETDTTIPPFPKYLAASSTRPLKVQMVLYLDKEKPLSEPKWVKTGDIEDWLRSMFGQAKSDAQNHASWSGKIIIADPDPPPNVYALIDTWVQHSMFGPPKERRRFANDHMRSSFENIVEILLRLVRTSGQGSTTQPSGSLLNSAVAPDSPYASQQTPLSLAVLSLFRMSTEFAATAGVESKALEGRVGQIVRALPQQMVYKSLDGMFKEWLAAQKKASQPRS